MANFSVFEKLRIVLSTILSTPLFFVSTLLGISLIVLMIICIVKKKKIPKWIFIIGWLLVIIFVALKYTKLVPTLIDNLVDTFIKCLYFPSLGLYVSIVVLSNIIFVIVNIQKKVRKSYKIVSLITAIILNILFILVAGVMTSNKIDITTEINLYTNSTLLVLLQLSMAIFVIFILLTLLIRIYNKITILDAVNFGEDYKYPEMDVYVNKNTFSGHNEVFVRKIMRPLRKKSDSIKVRKVMKKKS